MDYQEFLSSKNSRYEWQGISDAVLSDCLFDYQKAITSWALRKGRAAIFADCGLGKTLMQLEWARQVNLATNMKVLIVAPLAVCEQTKREALKFHLDDSFFEIINYERLHTIDPANYSGVVLDESSIIKSFTGKIRNQLIKLFADTPYKLACTATPSPNDYMELGNHAEFLGITSYTEMLAMYFIHDGGETSKWRLKGHGQAKFWEWLCTWAVFVRKPSDIGFDGDDFTLPALIETKHCIPDHDVKSETLIPMAVAGLGERIALRRDTVDIRMQKVAELARSMKDPVIIWCDLNAEAETLESLLPGSINVQGSDEDWFKAKSVLWFQGEICDCQLHTKDVSMLGCHLPKNISKSIIEKTEQKNSLPQTSTEKSTERKSESHQKNGVMTIKNGAKSTQNKPQSIETNCAESGTQPMQTTERIVKNRQENGQKTIQIRDLLKTSDNSELRQMITSKSLKIKTVDALSAELIAAIKLEGDCQLTTATTPTKCEDYSAQTAIKGLENSKTISISSKLPSCTCEGTKNNKILISKESILGFGVNLQNTHNMIFAAVNDSYEGYYQCVRRQWRYGQKNPVNVHLVYTERQQTIIENLSRKHEQMETMAAEMAQATNKLTQTELSGGKTDAYIIESTDDKSNDYHITLGDCVAGVAGEPDDSIDFCIFSPPFASLYTYSNSPNDMGNCTSDEDFTKHFAYLVKDLFRVIRPGRLVSFHCMNLPSTIQRDGFIGIKDFRGDLIRMFQDVGFIFHSEVVIWKDPVTAMQRTKALGLLHKQIKKDSCMSRQGIPDYLVTMRKPGVNTKPNSHTNETFPVGLWQNYASPVWMDINPSDTLQFREARESDDERHICPLQLQVIERAIKLWSAEGDVVLSPFMGIGSEGYMALKMNRKFRGFELKKSYYQLAKRNLETACDQLSLAI